MTERHRHADVLIALAEGRAVQYLYPDPHSCWTDMHGDINPLSEPDYEWRIKPEEDFVP